MDRNSPPLTGACACGETRYRLGSPPMIVHCCHCTSCRRESGAAFAVNAMIESDRLELLAGAPETILTPSESGKGQKIARCPACRVALWSHYAGAGEAVSFVRVGTLDDPGSCPPDVHIFTRSKLPWVVLPEGAPAVAAYYRTADVWPSESIARREALRGK